MTKVVLKCPSCGHMIDFGPNWIPVDLSKPKTNADRIRAMTDGELAEWIAELSDCAACKCDAKHPKCAVSDETCKNAWLDWLKKEVEA